MIAVIKGDIMASRTLTNQGVWMEPLKTLLKQWGNNPSDWEIIWGDFFQLEVADPLDALYKALMIKALIKRINTDQTKKRSSRLDVRMAIGIGEKSFVGERISESNGTAFILSGEKFSELRAANTNMAIKSPWPDFDEDINLNLRLVGLLMDNWSISSAVLMSIILDQPGITQFEIGQQLGIKQNSVSGRWKRTFVDEILKVENVYRKKLKSKIDAGIS